MNNITRYVMDIYQIGCILRDTLEYLVPKKDGYSVDLYRQRQAILKNHLAPNHAFDRFLNDNKEAGEKIRNNFNDFFDLVYGDESRAVFIESEKVVVDNGYFTQILDYVVGLHETITDICKGFIKHAEEIKQLEPDLTVLMDRDDHFYRCLASLIITDQVHRLFVEYNKSIREAKGQKSPQSNFINNELNKNLGFYRFVIQHSNYQDDIYQLAVSKTEHVIEVMGGKEKLEGGGEALRKEILNVHSLWSKNVALNEVEWRQIYQKMVNNVVAFDKEMIEKRKAQQASGEQKAESSDEPKAN